MDRSPITAALHQGHEAFIARILSVPEELRGRSKNEKWSPAQHLEHIRMSVRPVALALLLPRWFLRWRFGRPNRAPRDYDGLVQRYKEKLAAGGRAPSRFAPRALEAAEVPGACDTVRRHVVQVERRALRWSEADLDAYLLPHPLLGKLTVREMLFFTIYHVQHHQALVERDYPA